MPTWKNISLVNPITGELDLASAEVELNRRLRQAFANIDITQILFNLNDIGGTLNLSKGGTGQSLSAPAGDRLMFYDLSGNKVDWLQLGSGLSIVGTVISSTGAVINVTTKTATATLSEAEQGVILCNKATAMTINLPTAIGNEGLSYFITNINTGTVTIDPNGAETLQGDSSFDLYQDENIQIVSNNTNWYIR